MNNLFVRFFTMIAPYLKRTVARRGRGFDTIRRRKPVLFLLVACLVMFGQFIYLSEQAVFQAYRNKEKLEKISHLTETGARCKTELNALQVGGGFVDCTKIPVDKNPPPP